MLDSRTLRKIKTMKKLITKIINFYKDNWTHVVSMNACIFLIWFAYGCEPKTKSLLSPATEVTRAELIGELELLLAKYESRTEDLDKQEQLRDFVLKQTLIVANTGGVNPIGIATALLALLGLGAGVDDIRLRRQRAKQLTYEPVK